MTIGLAKRKAGLYFLQVASECDSVTQKAGQSNSAEAKLGSVSHVNCKSLDKFDV